MPGVTMIGAILAGGRSRRMAGLDKTRLTRDGQRVISRLAGLLRAACGECVLVAREEQRTELETLNVGAVLADLFPSKGPLGGMYTALEETETDLFLVACDLPFLTAPLISKIHDAYLKLEDQAIALLPRSPLDKTAVVHDTDSGFWRPEPLCAIWSRHCRRPAYAALDAEEFSVTGFAQQIQAHYLDLSFQEAGQLGNVNTRKELQHGLGIDV